MTRYFIALATAFLLLAPPAAANQQTSPKGAYLFVNDLGCSAVAVMQSDRLSQSGQHALLGKLLVQRMDFDTLARHILGSYARQASEQEFEKFTNYFAAHFIDLTLGRFADMPIVGFAAVNLLRQGDGDVVVVTRIVKDERKPLVVGWRVRARDGEYRIVDVLVRGRYSLALHFRNQYEAELAKHGIRSLISRLRRLTTGSPTVALVHQARGDKVAPGPGVASPCHGGRDHQAADRRRQRNAFAALVL